MNIELKLREFLKERFGNYSDDINADDSIEDVVDSMGLFDLVAYLEEEFTISIPTEDFTPRRFATISDTGRGPYDEVLETHTTATL